MIFQTNIGPSYLKFSFLPKDINKGSYMSAHVLLNVLNELRKRDKMLGFNLFFATSLINSIIQETNVRFYLSYDIKCTLKSHVWREKRYNFVIMCATLLWTS